MPIVQSFGALQGFRPAAQASGAAPAYYPTAGTGSYATYANIYANQPAVRTVIDFLARNIAQLGLHVFRRVSDTDRIRLSGHELVDWIEHPNPATSRYRLIESLMIDMGVYYCAYWLKVRLRDRLGLVRVPPDEIEVKGWLLPDAYIWTRPDGAQLPLAPRDLVAFRGHGPFNPLESLSPLETLRKTLLESAVALDYRAAYWNNAARFEGVIERPLAAPKWSPEQKQSWREQWNQRFSRSPGQIAVLEDGMSFKPTAWSASDSEYIPQRKLTREEVAAAYHVPLPMVGILEHATFSNIREQHKNLYQDCLGPWCEFLQEEIELQLLTECDDQTDVYAEFNIADKLKGSFEEQGASLNRLCGRPIMTGNEGRARLNLPAITDDASMDDVVLAMNTAAPSAAGDVGGGGDAENDEPDAPPIEKRLTPASGDLAPVVLAAWTRQRARLDKVPPDRRPAAFDLARWDRELAADLEPLYRAAGCDADQATVAASALASSINTETLRLLVMGEDAFRDRAVEV
jgi:HK97 family phage portal protein